MNGQSGPIVRLHAGDVDGKLEYELVLVQVVCKFFFLIDLILVLQNLVAWARMGVDHSQCPILNSIIALVFNQVLKFF